MNRLRCLTLATALAATLAACATSSTQQEPLAALAPDWREHSAPLLNEGRGTDASTTAWRMPSTLPPGRYLLVRDTPAGPVMVEGRSVEVTRGAERVHVMLPIGYSGVTAVDERSVLGRH
jgi:hypothetical protein